MVEGVTGSIAIHAVKTGDVLVKGNFRDAIGPSAVARLGIIADREFLPPLPIFTWVIAHPEGVFVVDTGENSRAASPRYYDNAPPPIRWFNKTQVHFQVAPDEEIGPQLMSLGTDPRSVKGVILTHLHIDHTDGLEHFAGVEVLVNEQEKRHPYFDFPYSYPTWFDPTQFNFRKGCVDVFDLAFPLTKAEDLVVVPTPGHTPNHVSVLLRTPKVDFLFGGDASFTQDQLLTGKVASVNADYKKTRRTYATIRDYAKKRPTVYLPSHDPLSRRRLENLEVFSS
jgi:glyoxylase-like metal-dependent hydrolase (beta-lactamase superfamily II)